MGHQSYVIPYDTPEQLQAILEIIKKHNSAAYHPEFVRFNRAAEYKQLESGEELGQLVTYQVKKSQMYKNPRNGPALSHVLMCGHGGGRSLTFDFFRFELMRAFPDVHVACFHAVDAYPYEASISNRLVRSSETIIGDENVKGTYSVEKDWLVQPAVYTTREAAGNPAFTELLSGLSGSEKKKRIREERDIPPYLQTFTSETKGFVVGNEVFAERAEAEARSKEIKDEYEERQRRWKQEKALQLERYKNRRASGKRYYQLNPKSTHRDHPDAKDGLFWLTAEEWAAMKASDWLDQDASCETKILDRSTWTRLTQDEIDAKIAAGEEVELSDV